VFAKKRISNSLQLAIGGFDSAFCLGGFCIKLGKLCESGFRCYKAELRSASTIPVRYVQWRLCGGHSAIATGNQWPVSAR
jgi:hypothetical protein